ncbi:SDR family oxidoreductase [Chitinophaga sp. CF418]|uniref:SDR family oxidoreductase n=1 Tax=Chitinophaga sp. CF418 TaxID=1855287 RepID=UPI00091C74A9|nr:SDR family oxidoreductase [Chitinophaga sp. CF418]SHN38626.1 Uncharacterized conserved protein YbjT, contains NAD(P)-binding and DUF2867 domains [Chitinophaga sp. CF418]
MKAVVIGGTGLIGRKLVEILSDRGHHVIAASPSSGVNSITGEGLDEAFDGVDVVIDVSNSPSFEDNAVLNFFQTSQKNIAAAEAAAGVKFHVALSIVGTDRLPDNGYFRAKVAQEKLIRESGIPYTIVHATQFMEFAGGIADSSMKGNDIYLSTGAIQPIAAAEVSEALADAVEAGPINGITEVAGPERFSMADFVRQYLTAKGDNRKVVADPQALYFGSVIDAQSLVPLGEARLGKITFQQWLDKQAVQA